MIPSSTSDATFPQFAVSVIPKETIIYHQPDSRSIPIEEQPARQCSFGPLGVLAAELLQLIIQIVDLKSLAALRLSNYSFKCLVDDTVEYQRVRKHASNAMRAMKESNTLKYHTLLDVCSALNSKFCVFCGEFGPCLFVLTCERCCLNCIARSPSLRLIPQSYAPTYYALPTQHLTSIKTLQVIPGQYRCRAYGGKLTTTRPGELLVMTSEVDERAIRFHGSREKVEQKVEEQYSILETERGLQGNGRSLLPINPLYAHYPLRNPLYDPHRESFYPGALEGFRFAGAVEFPALRRKTDQVEKALWCAACKSQFDGMGYQFSSDWSNWFRRWPKFVGRAFDEGAFLEHIKSCEHAQALSRDIEEGNSNV